MHDDALRNCKALRKDGRPCKAPPTAGGLCYFHANPDQVRLLGRIGGRKNRRGTVEAELRAPLEPAEVREILAQAILDVRANALAPRAVTAIANAASVLLRTIHVVDLEERVAKLEQAVEEDRAAPATRKGSASAAESDDNRRCWYTDEERVEPESSPGSPPRKSV